MSLVNYLSKCMESNKTNLKKLDQDISACQIQLTDIKLRLSTLEIQMFTMKKIYEDVMELRKILKILNPHLKISS